MTYFWLTQQKHKSFNWCSKMYIENLTNVSFYLSDFCYCQILVTLLMVQSPKSLLNILVSWWKYSSSSLRLFFSVSKSLSDTPCFEVLSFSTQKSWTLCLWWFKMHIVGYLGDCSMRRLIVKRRMALDWYWTECKLYFCCIICQYLRLNCNQLWALWTSLNRGWRQTKWTNREDKCSEVLQNNGPITTQWTYEYAEQTWTNVTTEGLNLTSQDQCEQWHVQSYNLWRFEHE